MARAVANNEEKQCMIECEICGGLSGWEVEE